MISYHLSRILIRLSSRLLGVGLLLASFVLFVSLISFNSEDPSFNTLSTEAGISNWMGASGAYISDISFQFIGFASFILCLIIFSFGLKLSSKEGLNNTAIKLILTPFCLLCFSVFFATIPQGEWWPLNSFGGLNGYFILNKITFLPRFATAFFAMIFGLVTISVICEIHLRDWLYFFRYVIVYLQTAFYYAKESLITNVNDSEEEVEEVKPKKKKTKKAKVVEEIEEEEEEIMEEDSVEDLKKKLKETQTKESRKKSAYKLPMPDLLTDRSAENKNKRISKEVIEEQSKLLLKVLDDFGVQGTSLGARVGPVVTVHEFEPAAGTKASRVINLSEDIARSMSAVSARIAVVAGKTSMGIELPNDKRQMIFLREFIENKEYKFSQHSLPMILGKDIGGDIVITDLARMPHLLIAGTTGSGKSVGLNVMILSLLFRLRPDECKFIMIDPKMLELSIYDGIPHLLSPVITEPQKAVTALKWVVAEMEERYRLMSSFAVRNIAGYNEKAEKAAAAGKMLKRKVQTGYDASTGQPIIEEIDFEPKKIPFIVVIVDELADLMLVAGKEIEGSIQRLAQMARAAGIHIIMATQRPSVDVITGVIKANFPTRISFQVTSRIDSRTILGTQGAEQLLGQGDMIHMSGGSKMTRVHGPFCSDTEIENIVNFIKDQDLSEFEEEEKISFEAVIAQEKSSSEFSGGGGAEPGSDEDLYQKAVMIVRRDKKPSISYVQRQLRIGYNRAAILIERMEEEGVVSSPNVSGKREILE